MQSKTHVLLIEDNPGDVRLIKEFFRAPNAQEYELFFSESLEGGRKILLSEKIDIILLDLILPDSMGFDTFLALYNEFPTYPIIVLTGLQDAKLGLRALKHGGQDFLNKEQLNADLLIKTIQYGIERKKLLRDLEEAQTMAKMGTWSLDLTTNEMTVSPIVFSIFEKEPGKGLASLRDYLEIVHPQDQKAVALELKKVFESGGTFETYHKILLASEKVKYVIFQGKTENDINDNPVRLVGTIQDVTERNEVENLKREKELAEESIKLRQEFLAKTSHEIRTPLNPILLLTTLLLDSQSNLTLQQREQLEAIKAAGDTLLAVVNDILDLSKIEAGKIDFSKQAFSLRQVFDHMEDMMELNAKEKNLQLNKHIDPRIPDKLVGDNVRLTQILLNLVGNAIKFTHKGSITVDAHLKSLEAEEALIQFKVTDTGIGIPHNKKKLIFESFQQVENDDNRRNGGTGLGLTIVRQLVKLQGGNIEVESEEGKGSVFEFELAFGLTTEEFEQPFKKAIEIDKNKLSGVEILLVEDNPLNQMVTKKLLLDWGIHLQIANNGREGIEKLKERNYDLILMDVQMPEMDGYEATRYIRQQMKSPEKDIPIIALTANAFSGSDDQCLQVGMNDYVSKPIEIVNLYSKIVQHANPEKLNRTPQEEDTAGSNGSENQGNGGDQQEGEKDNHTEVEMAEQQYTDLSYLNQISGGDEIIIKKTVEKFLETTPEMLDSMDSQLAEGDLDQLGKTAHKLKSSVAFMGIEAIRETILEIERIVKTHDEEDKLAPLVGRVRYVIEKSFGELKATLPAV